ncbi:MAG: BlaI/MecI/CopY family transcriptional regulator [Bacteroidales bacterium]|nr:BlaI/MecI/CopY family transcriptional regulator [Bacteroidales bacterium]
MRNQTLTKSEMAVMNILWEMPNGGTVYDVLEHYEEPKPAYTTLATFMKILEKKGYLESKKLSGRTFTFFPLESKEEYSRRAMQEVKKTLFDGSAKSLLSFFVQEEKLSAKDIEELLTLVKK